MINRADISVRLVHIDGPRKGETDKNKRSIIQIGRHPDCDVLYPADELSISRKHAQIIRTGNRFRLLNQSPNGSFVNGNIKHSTFLHNGDVIMFSKDGPKLSFLFTLEKPISTESIKTPVRHLHSRDSGNHFRDFSNNVNRDSKSVTFDESQKTEYTIQYGTKIYSFNQHMIKIGSHSNNDVVIQHPLIMDQHAEIRHQHNNFFIKGIYQRSVIYLNKRLVKKYTRLIKHDLIHLGQDGPLIRYLGTGRFMEVINKTTQSTTNVIYQDNFPQANLQTNTNMNDYNQPL